ncbi:hypothetical protein, conserved [Trypanosoma brucei gambiense DAL972]|uniref:PGAP1-like protein n=1 Tax=Trypanosoma brucei gambiense (strain MHOM/CI/86/DAL972) TaxID=679716 RepID=C9ZYN2_TRYB9|nr:hypothetical protein, conserved [Trypanosoma brucei gambiense DAL972]CBH14531.1 hypothetical protein, conserved [Trypanosoma brucei gambiense DAL972]|eukprot:XP_011776797.1 hypothetical protein, conserved [Trypanosoma brucei gambiense DAL972]
MVGKRGRRQSPVVPLPVGLLSGSTVVGCFRAWSRKELLVLLLSASFTLFFAFSAVRWLTTTVRTDLQAILVEAEPTFVEVPFDPPTGKFYKLWRYRDNKTDSFRKLQPQAFPNVPVIYIHGNAGCYQDMRFFGRVVGESVVRLRRYNAIHYGERVRNKIFQLYKNEGSELPRAGIQIPKDIQRRAENMVVADTPMLGVELFAPDFLEESNAHSAIVMAREAMYLNHSVHELFRRFLDHYHDVLKQPPGDLRHAAGGNRSEIPVVASVENEYVDSACGTWSEYSPDPSACSTLKKEVAMFSSTERIRQEVQRVEREGIWLWTESIGGVLGVFAALLAPELYAGLVMAGPPLRYSPLLFDLPAVYFQKTIQDAVTVPYANISNTQRNWSKILAGSSTYELLKNLNSVPHADIAGRLERVSLVSVHGGALEDIVPPRSSHIMRTVSRRSTSPEHQPLLATKPPYAGRRDVCTEELRGCGISLSHRGLVYAVQLLDSAGYYTVVASLTGEAGRLVGVESTLPVGRERMFPMVLETLSRNSDAYRAEKFRFTTALHYDSENDKYHMTDGRHFMNGLTRLCADGQSTLNLQDLPVSEDEDTESWSPLHIFVGATTYEAEEVILPELTLVADEENEEPLSQSNLQVRLATKLHLPYRRKDSNVTEGTVLRTALSFQVLRRRREQSSLRLRPRFCFFVRNEKVNVSHFALVQHDVIDPLRELSSPEVHDATLYSQLSGDISVEKYGRFSLIRNMRVSQMETSLSLYVKNRTVYPVTICGSLRSLRVTFRGGEKVALDEPEAQNQYFFGPYGENVSSFTYSWRPFHTTPFNVTNVYVVYVLTPDIQPKMDFEDTKMHQSPEWIKPSYWLWRLNYDSLRWMAIGTTYSVAIQLISCYVLFFFVIIVVFHVPRLARGGGEPEKGVRGFFEVSPTILAIAVGLGIELASLHVVRQTLSVCLDEEPPRVSGGNITDMMSLSEALTLLFLCALPPRLDTCRHSWIRMVAAVPADVTLEHMVHLVFSYCLTVLSVSLMQVQYYLLWPLFKVIRPLLIRRPSGRLAVWPFAFLWLAPMVLHITVYWMHVYVTTNISCIFALASLWCIPEEMFTNTGRRYQQLCLLVLFPIQLATHFEGSGLLIRNYFMLPTETLTDSERFESLPEQIIALTVAQGCLAVVYGTVYLALLHQDGITDRGSAKKMQYVGGTNCSGGEKRREGKKRKQRERLESQEVLGERTIEHLEYSMGDLGRRYPKLKLLAKVGSFTFMFVACWMGVVALRRPLEGTVFLFGLSVVAARVAFALLSFW